MAIRRLKKIKCLPADFIRPAPLPRNYQHPTNIYHSPFGIIDLELFGGTAESYQFECMNIKNSLSN